MAEAAFVTDPARRLTGAELPHRLADLPCPPLTLYLRGELPRGPSVAIVGTRTPTRRARAFTRRLAAELTERGVTVFSGGALGIDSAAHLGALDAGGRTVVVAPAGFDAAFPASNRGLFARVVAEGGAYVSLVPDEQPAKRGAFFARNGCLAALTHLLVVVEAPFRSGARNAASWARRLARPLFIVPSAPWNKRGAGSLLELRRGAKLCTGPADVFAELERQLLVPLAPTCSRRSSGASRQGELRFGAPVPGAQRGHSERERVRGAIIAGARHLDDVCQRTGLPAGVVQNHVLTLTLEGALAPDPLGWLQPTGPVTLVSVDKSSKLQE
ncbi:MAG TPA: DNA-processing protein DprA [Polyangiaceae bacterium]